MKNNLFYLFLVFACSCTLLPAQSGFLSVLSTIPVSPTFEVAVKGNILYLNPGVNAIYLYDISDPANPVALPQVPYSGDYTHTIRIDGDYLYLAGGPSGLFRIFDISIPTSPQALGMTAFGNQGSVHTAHTADVSYIANEETLYIVNTADKNNPFISDSILVPTSAPYGLRDPHIHQNNLYFGVSGGFLIYDITNPLQPVAQAPFANGFVTTAINRNDEILFIANGSGGGHIAADISNPNAANLLFLGSGGTASSGKMCYQSGYLLQTGPDPGPPTVNSVNLFRTTTGSSIWREEFFGPYQFMVTDIIGKDSLFIVSKFGGVEILGFGSYEVGVDQASLGSLELWPNPSSGSVRIALAEAIESGEVVVRDLRGKRMMAVPMEGMEKVLHVEDLAAGMYLVEVRGEDGRRAAKRFCKN